MEEVLEFEELKRVRTLIIVQTFTCSVICSIYGSVLYSLGTNVFTSFSSTHARIWDSAGVRV